MLVLFLGVLVLFPALWSSLRLLLSSELSLSLWLSDDEEEEEDPELPRDDASESVSGSDSADIVESADNSNEGFDKPSFVSMPKASQSNSAGSVSGMLIQT